MSDRLRVLQILPNRFYLGGAEIMVFQLLMALDRERFEPAAVTYFDPAGTHLDAALAEAGVPVWYLNKRLGFDPGVSLRLDGVLARFRPHVVHTHMSALRYALWPCLRRRPGAMLHTVHTLAEKETARRINGLAFRLGVAPVAIAEEVAASLSRLHGLGAVPLVPNGIPVAAFRQAASARSAWREEAGFGPEDVLFVSVARLMPVKNHQLLIEAFARGLGQAANAHLLLVGEGELRPELERQIADRGLTARVHLLGRRTDIPAVLAAADAFVLASDWEGNPLSVMEAMAAGKPVVATAVGGVPELVTPGETGQLVPPGDALAMAEALRALYAQPEARKAMGERAAGRAQAAYDVGGMARAYETLYTHMLSRAGALRA